MEQIILFDDLEASFLFCFQDNVNRKIVLELLIDHALKNTSRQFVFLTPQDTSSVTAGPNIKIHRYGFYIIYFLI